MKKSLKFRVAEWIVRRLKKLMDSNRVAANFIADALESGELGEIYLFDFKDPNFDTRDLIAGDIVVDGTFLESTTPSTSKTSQKIKVKPVDVLRELETVPTPWSMLALDDKISILRDKAKLIKQRYAKREVNGLIERLENRKKYNEFRSFFDPFQNTTDEKIDALLEKYELVMKSSDIFIPEFPKVAIDIMNNYTNKMKELCNKKPVFYVIATADSFKKSYKRRDPILLVQSPLGFYWQILGAWDSEMILLTEL
ncbi:MAG: hypothetical protein PHT07_21630 [Paludibacter sp.]|nr:hypothetical protein [Paludibacter sp.]